jgi:DNA-binding transcriptional MerR regulator
MTVDESVKTGSRSPLMTIGELSRRTGLPIRNLREYTDLGLIYTVGRDPSNYGLYKADALWCVHWIGRLRGLGLTIGEIRDLTSAHARRSFGPQLAEQLKICRGRLLQRIARLEEILQRIDEFESTYQADLSPDGEAGDPTHDARPNFSTFESECLTHNPG